MARQWIRTWIIRRKGKKGSTYQVVYYDRRRRKRTYDRSFRVERLAKEHARKLELNLNGAGPKPTLGPEPSQDDRPDQAVPLRPWDEATTAWVESCPIRPKTVQNYTILLRCFGSDTGVRYVEDVTETMVSGFLVALRKRGRSVATTGTYLRVLAAFFRAIRPTDCPITKKLIATWRPYKNHKRQRPHLYTDDEYRRMMEACDTISARGGRRDGLWWKTFITLLHDCGLRMNEAAHLIWRDIDFEAGELRIAPHVNLSDVLPWRPKGKARRTLPLSPSLTSLFASMQAAQPEKLPYVFLSKARYFKLRKEGVSAGGHILNGLRKGFIDIRTRAGIDEGTVHDMRRTFVTNWLRKPEMSPEEVQLLAGHEDIMTTLKVYAEVSEADVVAKAKRLLQNSTDNASTMASTTKGS